MAIAKVEPLTTARALRGPFDYRLPEEMDGVGVGSVLVVPFGRRRVLGVVVEIAEASELPPGRLAQPVEVHEARVPDELVRLGKWAAREYCSTPARGLGLVLPPGTGVGGQRVRSRFESLVEATARGRAAIANDARLGSRQRAVLEALVAGPKDDPDGEGHSAANAAELATACGADRATLRRLEARGLVQVREVEVGRRPASACVGQPPRAVRLTAEQDEAVSRIVGAMDGAGEAHELLLHGVTGSGKTEVYLAAAAAAMERGRAAIVLVPEIGLTPQTVARFRDRFGDAVALLHSRLPAGARYDEWGRLRSGEARMCVGPRSAIFAPVSDLGLIVIDEEHDGSYKQEGDPRYDARHVARRRAAEAGAVLVAGSATPRPESWMELQRLELPRRVDGRELPGVDVLDMRGGGRRSGPLHARTREALQALRARGGKAILMLNRRGWAPHLSCRSCGHTWGCPDCDVSLVLHRRAERLACHHCGHAEPLPESCPECDSVTLARHGAGTERLERLLAELVDPLPVFRLDSDSAARGGGHLEILRRFQAADAGVLLGTQMVAKGHDFADVVLSVLLDADAALRFPDFRAEERAFALVAQLAGRSGRGEGGGTVLVQTLAPDARAIEAAARHDTAGFLAGELERRRVLRYPPFSHLVRVGLAAAEVADAERAADEMHSLIGERLPRDTDLLGPAPRFRLRGRHRRQLLLKGGDRAATVAAVRDAVESAAGGRMLRGVSLGVDVDPQ
ncbi:MAG TPA: primosomal protein N' [Solirubrobacterales bacterium]|nr:primosomal protein N' [Solirubrobacterales bacterium]